MWGLGFRCGLLARDGLLMYFLYMLIKSATPNSGPILRTRQLVGDPVVSGTWSGLWEPTAHASVVPLLGCVVHLL